MHSAEKAEECIEKLNNIVRRLHETVETFIYDPEKAKECAEKLSDITLQIRETIEVFETNIRCREGECPYYKVLQTSAMCPDECPYKLIFERFQEACLRIRKEVCEFRGIW